MWMLLTLQKKGLSFALDALVEPETVGLFSRNALKTRKDYVDPFDFLEKGLSIALDAPVEPETVGLFSRNALKTRKDYVDTFDFLEKGVMLCFGCSCGIWHSWVVLAECAEGLEVSILSCEMCR